MKIHLDGRGGEGGKNGGVREDFLVSDDLDLGMVRVEPGGDLSVCDNEDTVDPRSKTLQGPKRILQFVVVAESTCCRCFRRGLCAVRLTSVVHHLLEPLGIGAVHPRIDDVDLRVTETIAKRAMSNVVGVRFRAVVRFHQRSGLVEVL